MNYDDVDIVRCDIPDTEASREADTRRAALESILDSLSGVRIVRDRDDCQLSVEITTHCEMFALY